LWHAVLGEASFYELLEREDEQSAQRARAAGCPHCGGRLHSARYPRKPRGALLELGAGYDRRLSFCCAEDGCRRRTTPPSLRYLGRRAYLAAVVVLATALRQGVTPLRASKLRELFGVDRRTLMRWRRWWLETFVQTPLWRARRALLAVTVAEQELPAPLLDRFAGTPHERVVAVLRLLAPLTTRSGDIAAL